MPKPDKTREKLLENKEVVWQMVKLTDCSQTILQNKSWLQRDVPLL